MKVPSIFLLFINTVASMPQSHHGMFMPMHCNLMLGSVPCHAFSSQRYNLSEPIQIPCGECITMDLDGDIVFEKGLDVQGKLIFPSSRKALKITTPHIFVQGDFVVEPLESHVIPQRDRELEFHFVGKELVTFKSHYNQSFTKCESGCDVSKKPFVVAGGSMDIQGMDSSCDTWGRLQSIVEADAPAMDVTPPPSVRSGCSEVLVLETFQSSALTNKWDGLGASKYEVENGYFSVSQRSSGIQGPRIYLPLECITPDQDYILRFKYRYRDSMNASFGVPWLKMIRSDATDNSNQWINVDYVNDRGNIADVSTDTWYDMQVTIQFSAIMTDANSTSSLSLYIAPFSNVETIDLDDFELRLAPDFADRSCENLLIAAPGYVYPYYTTGGMLTIGTDSTDNTAQEYLRSSLRTSKYQSALTQDIASECLTKAAVYSFSAQVRVHSTEERQVEFTMDTSEGQDVIVRCPPSANGKWVDCEGSYRVTSNTLTNPRLYTFVLDDETSMVDFANISFRYNGGQVTKLTLEDTTNNTCWGSGAEILITSSTINHDDAQVALIESVDNNGVITLRDPIFKPITLDDDAQTAVEVALLSRNIKLTAAEDDDKSPLDGGHLIIMHTSSPVIQTIIGMESHGFGQQGKLGRYPLHFHMCDSVRGSIISKNCVRNTKQRGIVVHGTNDLDLTQNILHNTRGHAIMLEDGGETGNRFEHNLGAVGHGVEVLISDEESDNTPATFWITNPQNTWIGNVAAGSQFSGFWFEVKTRVRGPSKMNFPDMIPNKLDLQNFTDNVSHSNAQGLQTYPQTGYRPDNLAVFQNHKSFRNRVAGVFFHAGGRLAIDGGYLSDNKVAIDIDMDHSDVVTNTVIVGSSSAYQEIVESIGSAAYQWPEAALCRKDNRMVGIRLDSYHDGSLFGARGSTLKNVTFSGFGPSSCPDSSALHVDSEDVRYFDTRNTLEQVLVLDDTQPIDLCGGEPQVAIRNTDGSFVGGQPGFIISDTVAIRAHPDCTTLVGSACAAFCPGSCLRTLTVSIPSFYRRLELTLKVTGTLADGRAIAPVYIKDFQTKQINQPNQERSQGRLFVTLPSGGNYYGIFLDEENEVVWPLYTDLRYEDASGNCGPDFASFEINQGNQVPTCEQLIQNGDFENGIDYWWHVGNLGLELASDGADGSSKSLLAPNTAQDGGRHIGMGQYLDTRCIEEGYTYSFAALIKFTGNYQCNLNGGSSDAYSCPSATLRLKNDITESISWINVGKMKENDKEWNLIAGSFTANQLNADSYSAFVYINGVPAGVDIQIDKVTLTRSYTTPFPTKSPTVPPTKPPTGSPTISPTIPPTHKPSPSPTSIPVKDGVESSQQFEGTASDAVQFIGADSIRLVTERGQDATVITKSSHIGDIDFITHFGDRLVSDSGYQPHLILFFAPETASVEDLTTNDNGFGTYFESTVVSWMRERIYCCLPYTWFLVKALDSAGTMVHGSRSHNIQMTDSGSLRLKRTAGVISSYYSFDHGSTWTQIGSDILLPEAYRQTPLKIGFRMKREWKTVYDITVNPIIVSEGEVKPAVVTGPQSSLTDNVETQSATCGQDGCQLAGPDYNAGVISKESYAGDIRFTVKVMHREYFGTGYQSGLWLFFATEDSSLDTFPFSRGSDDDFKTKSIAAVGDKIHYNCCEHTWTYMSSQTDAGRSDQSGGDSWKNTDGYLRLERIGGVIKASMSSNGNGWKEIGAPKALPSNLAHATIKVGIRSMRNWASGYDITVLPTVEQL